MVESPPTFWVAAIRHKVVQGKFVIYKVSFKILTLNKTWPFWTQQPPFTYVWLQFSLSWTGTFGQQHSSISSSPEQYSFLLIALKLVLSLRVFWHLVDVWGEALPLKSFWTLGHSPLASSLSTRVTWNVGTKEASTAIWSTAHRESWSPLSTHRSMRAPLRPQGSLEAKWSSSWLMLCSRKSGRMSLEQPRLYDAPWRLCVMLAATSAANVSSRGYQRKLLSDSDRDVSVKDPKRQ